MKPSMRKNPKTDKPMRRCVGCRVSKEKTSLLRVVAGSDNKGLMDPGFREEGRGAYICRDISCLEKARKSKGFERSIHISGDRIYDALKEELS